MESFALLFVYLAEEEGVFLVSLAAKRVDRLARGCEGTSSNSQIWPKYIIIYKSKIREK